MGLARWGPRADEGCKGHSGSHPLQAAGDCHRFGHFCNGGPKSQEEAPPAVYRIEFGAIENAMTEREKPDLFAAKATRLVLLSDRILGDPKEIDAMEAQELLRAANIDPQERKARFHRRV